MRKVLTSIRCSHLLRILEDNRIPIPKHLVLDRTRGDEVNETDDAIEIGGQMMKKPFVMKPIDAEDHDVSFLPTVLLLKAVDLYLFPP